MLLTKNQLADQLSVSVRTLDRIRRTEAGFPTPITVGASPRWRVRDIDDWIAGKVPAPAPTRGRRKSAAEHLA